MAVGISRRAFLRSVGAGAATAALARAGYGAAGSGDRPDVLLIIAEDLKTSLGCYGNPVVQTPHLDALAAGGLRFDNAQCSFPVCCPTRAALLSGLSPRTTGVMGNAIDWSPLLKPGTTLPEYFRAQGYETVRVGKIFHEGNGDRVYDDTPRWSRIVPEGQGIPGPQKKARPPRFLYSSLTPEERAKQYDTRAWVWGPTGLDDIEMSDGRIAEQAVRLLGQKQEKPLFLALGFHKSHLPLQAPDRYFDLYPPDKIPLPNYAENCLDGLPHRYGLANHKAFTPETRREAIAAYYACTSYLDACVGRVLAALKETGRDKKTLVVFVGDHGFHLGEHLLWQKMTLFEESCRVPLLLSMPGTAMPGGVCTRPVMQADLYPTLAELCGLPAPQGLEVASMAAVVRRPDAPWRKGAITIMGPNTSIRTERWRYNEWGGPAKAELYDHEKDPRELVNLASDAEHRDTVTELSRLIAGGWQATAPAG